MGVQSNSPHYHLLVVMNVPENLGFECHQGAKIVTHRKLCSLPLYSPTKMCKDFMQLQGKKSWVPRMPRNGSNVTSHLGRRSGNTTQFVSNHWWFIHVYPFYQKLNWQILFPDHCHFKGYHTVWWDLMRFISSMGTSAGFLRSHGCHRSKQKTADEGAWPCRINLPTFLGIAHTSSPWCLKQGDTYMVVGQNPGTHPWYPKIVVFFDDYSPKYDDHCFWPIPRRN